jgi:trigger factor
VKLVDTLDLGSSAARRGGSSPSTRTYFDDEMLSKEVDNLARRYGKLVPAEEVGEKDMVMGEFSEVEGEIKNNSTVSMEFIEDNATKKKFTGAKVGDVITVDPKKVSKGDSDMASMLGVSEEEVAAIKSKFDFKITEIKRMEPHAIDQELFDKLFGEGNIKSEDELKERVKSDLQNMFSSDADRVFNQKIVDELVEKTKVELPEEFLKRWILASSKEDVTAEQIEADFDNYKKSLKWQLIQNKIIKENDLKVEPQEAMDYTKSLLANQYAQYGMPAPEDAQLNDQARNVLTNQEEANRIYDNLYMNKIMAYFKETVKLNEKALPYEKFVEEAYGTK